jgi:probable phosphomutase (TIGR03848 family)
MTIFLLIRHAVHLLGSERIAGRMPDVHLSPRGQEQAQQLAKRLAAVPIRALYCSPITRAQETAQALAAQFDLPVQTCDDIQELNYGDWTGRTLEELRPLEQWKQWNSFRSGTRIPNGESMLEIQARIVSQMQRLKEQHPNEVVALVSHGDVIKAAVAYCLGVPLDMFQRIEISPASVSVVGIADYGPWVLCVNNTNEPGELPTLNKS